MLFVVWIVFLVLIFYLFLIRPQQRRARRHQELIYELKVGDQVVTLGGVHGRIKALKDDTVVIELTQQVMVTFDRSAIARKVDSGDSPR